jgi:ABC-type Fe3+-siderophore transport system permease subunit
MPNSGAKPSNRTATRTRRANPTGLYVAIVGILIFNVAPFLDWFTNDDGETFSGYEGDSLIPFIAYFGIGLAAALLYAHGRAERRQHRGLSLAAMAVGIAALAQSVATVIDVPGAMERGGDLQTELGVYVALLGGAIWAAGAALFAKEPEGDPETTAVDDIRIPDTDRAATRR